MKYELTDGLLEQLATLSQLDISSDDKATLHRDLEQMLSYVDKISELDTDNALIPGPFPECIQLPDCDTDSSLREDFPCRETAPEQLLSLSPRKADSYYIVPNAINGADS